MANCIARWIKVLAQYVIVARNKYMIQHKNVYMYVLADSFKFLQVLRTVLLPLCGISV